MVCEMKQEEKKREGKRRQRKKEMIRKLEVSSPLSTKASLSFFLSPNCLHLRKQKRKEESDENLEADIPKKRRNASNKNPQRER